MKKRIAWISGTATLKIDAPAAEGVAELKKMGAKINTVMGDTTTGMLFDCPLERAQELVDAGWEWY